MRIRFVASIFFVLSLLVPSAVAAQTTTETNPALEAAVVWLVDQQQADGSWLGFTGEADAGTTVDAIISLAAAGEAGADIDAAIAGALAWLEADDAALAYAQSGVGQAAKLVLALAAAGIDDLSIGGLMPLELVLHGQDEETGIFGFGLYDHAYALMALAVSGSDIPLSAVDAIVDAQAPNGGFAWDGSAVDENSDSNTSAMMVMALIAAGQAGTPATLAAMDYLGETVTDTGAGYAIGADADANSTALVAQAFIANGDDAEILIAALDGFQGESGAYFWMDADPADNLFSTIQVIPAMSGVAFPYAPADFAYVVQAA